MASGIRIKLDQINPRLKRLRRLFAGSALNRYIVTEMAKEARKHYQETNDKYSHESRFYRYEGEDVVKAHNVTATHAVITVGSEKMGHKFYGGTVFATRTKFLAIPLTQPAKWRTPRQYGMGSHSPLFFCPNKVKDGGVLVDKRSGVAWYALKRRVTHRAFEDRAMPAHQRLIDVAIEAVNKLINKNL